MKKFLVNISYDEFLALMPVKAEDSDEAIQKVLDYLQFDMEFGESVGGYFQAKAVEINTD